MEIGIVDVFSIIASALSLALAVIAIWLSIAFYRMSDKTAKDAEKASNNIDANVKKLETLFDKLYSGTFDMMRETVTDMRKHAYKNVNETIDSEKVTKEIEEKTLQVVIKAVEEIKTNQKSDKELEKLILNIINKSKELEESVKMNVISEEIIYLLKKNGEMPFFKIDEYLVNKGLINNDASIMFEELDKLALKGIIVDPFVRTLNGDAESISHNVMIKLK